MLQASACSIIRYIAYDTSPAVLPPAGPLRHATMRAFSAAESSGLPHQASAGGAQSSRGECALQPLHRS
jgi:hypothetical protein